MIMLKKARLIDPSTRTDDIRDIIIAERKVIKIGEELLLDAQIIAQAKGEKLTIIDCEGMIAAPGLVDVHVHFREPGFTYKEDIMSVSAAGAAGGFTTLVGMANTKPPVDNPDVIMHIAKEGRKAPIRIKTCACVTKGMEGKELVDMKLLKECGVVGFTDDGRPILDTELAKEAMRLSRNLKLPISFHEEDPKYIKENGINKGEVAKKLGLVGSDRMAEVSMVERDCKLAKDLGATVSIQHISAKESVEAVRRAKKEGARVYAEATPHHFTLTERAVLEHGTNAKMNPPLRLEEDRLAIIEGLKDGTIEIIATDHAPHSKEEKDRDFDRAPSGIIGLETALSLGIMHLVDEGHLSMSQLISKMSYEPAKLYHLDAGVLREDSVADVVVFDPEAEWEYNSTRSKSSNSPWMNKKLKGKVILTICGGTIEYDAR